MGQQAVHSLSQPYSVPGRAERGIWEEPGRHDLEGKTVSHRLGQQLWGSETAWLEGYVLERRGACSPPK